MKRYTTLLVTLFAALALTLTGCGGGGSGGAAPAAGGGGGGGGAPVEADPTFATTAPLTEADAAAAFSAAVALDDGAGTPASPMMVVGTTDGGAGTTLQAVAWSVTDTTGATLGAPVILPVPAGVLYSRSNGLNDAGAIVGEMNAPIVPAFWADSTTEAVILPLGVAVEGSAYDINTAGRIVGETIAVAAGPAAAVIWADELTNPVSLAPAALASSAYAMTDGDLTEIVGELTDVDGVHAVVWQETAPGVFDTVLLPGAGTLTGDSVALAINDEGHIAGEIMAADNNIHAVRWLKTGTGYTVEDLGQGTALGINAAEQVVGQDSQGGAAAWRATAPLTPFPIGTSEPTASQGCAINTAGRAVGVNNSLAFIALP